jgi:hypothetical protein
MLTSCDGHYLVLERLIVMRGCVWYFGYRHQ